MGFEEQLIEFAMALADTVDRIRSGVFHIVCLDDQGNRIASGTAFSSYGYLITNAHVARVPAGCTVWIRREGDGQNDGFKIKGQKFRFQQKSASDENNYDFSIIDLPEVTEKPGTYSFTMRSPENYRVGQIVAFLGYPLEHQNLSCHSGIISSLYRSGPVRVLQLDASVNVSNSGGPLFDIESGEVIGIITRKATGLTRIFGELREAINKNLAIVEETRKSGSITLMGIDPNAAFVASQNQMLHTISEIERQANVGIGYAFSVEHIMNDNLIHSRL
ncbi:serine protease [Mesorhizobium sp. M2C.T.Ca.TU.002.02.1.1]|uniref:S1 family peptidase n=1 Tax=Mesorhizobium sp. M2C.T.Ca.TU.002.02.1.1 TaxID=2496788 RepID=UPI000FC9C6C2|nr:serine protease [Mesorhizobium sp. M2C.T.Ca.TU.002.02.1.1]RUU64142.1 serine protease [Mesorhizobium sp. M2C.T.Ca.TU.009.01.2.1]